MAAEFAMRDLWILQVGAAKSAELDDIEKIVASLDKNGVDFMIIGSYAVIFHDCVIRTVFYIITLW